MTKGKMKKRLQSIKCILPLVVICFIAILLEVFVFNFSFWRTCNLKPIIVVENVNMQDTLEYWTEVVAIDGEVKSIDVDMDVKFRDTAFVMAAITDEGDKYEYYTPEYNVCNGVRASGYSNVYPFDDVHTIQIRVRILDGSIADIHSVTVNAHKPFDFKAIRFLIVLSILLFGYLVWKPTALHSIYYDEKKLWQNIVTIVVIVGLLMLGRKLSTANNLIVESPWPHHKQYQELAYNLEQGSVKLNQHIPDSRLINATNPYDTIALIVEEVPYLMDYAYFDGNYYSYFGIVPELLLYYPYYRLKGVDLPNYKAVYVFYVAFVIGVFLTTSGWIHKNEASIPYFFYILLNIAVVMCANFIYLLARGDIYNVPIMGAIACTFTGIGCWLYAVSMKKRSLRIIAFAIGSLCMAAVAGCRPQLLLVSALAVVWFVFENGIKQRRLFTVKNYAETVAFCVPYLLVAALVCWYNYARFGSIFDFGATYSLTTNDMNHRGFNFERLLRSMYYYLFQPANMSTDFPYLLPSNVEGAYMGRFMCEYTYGGILIANAFLASIWLCIIKGIKKSTKVAKITVATLLICAVTIAAFDANAAGVLYRYTCDFAPALVLAAVFLWLLYLDRGHVLVDYSVVSRLAYVCILISLGYSFMTFMAGGSSVNLADNSSILYYQIASYFSW